MLTFLDYFFFFFKSRVDSTRVSQGLFVYHSSLQEDAFADVGFSGEKVCMELSVEGEGAFSSFPPPRKLHLPRASCTLVYPFSEVKIKHVMSLQLSTYPALICVSFFLIEKVSKAKS